MKNYFTYIFVLMLMFSCSKKEEKKEPIKVLEPTIEETIKEPTEIVKEIPELIYTIQIAALKNTNDKLANLANVKMYEENGLTKYRFGDFKTYEEARKYRLALLNKFDDAFIQALKNEVPIHIKDALEN